MIDRRVSTDDLPAVRLRWANDRIVLATGCFDLIHTGHLMFLEEARSCGTLLVVGVNSDASVRAIKGPQRPIVGLDDRLGLVASLRVVDAAFPFDDRDAASWIRALKPDTFATNEESLVLYPDEKAAALAVGCAIHIVRRDGGPSTSATIRAMEQGSSDLPQH